MERCSLMRALDAAYMLCGYYARFCLSDSRERRVGEGGKEGALCVQERREQGRKE